MFEVESNNFQLNNFLKPNNLQHIFGIYYYDTYLWRK